MKRSLMVVLLSSFVFADVSITSASFQEKKVGKETKWVKATRVIPGTKVRYVNSLSNGGAESATNLVVTNAIPNHMSFVASSASCSAKCDVVYSLDNKSFDVPSRLLVTENGKQRVANTDEYRAVRWTLSSLSGKQKCAVQYDATLK